MGVIYKLKDEVVQFIISQRQDNPLLSCRQLAESASQKFGLHLSKSSVHDVLKESGIITPRGRKPAPKFEIPEEKKKQIQESLSQIKLLPAPVEALAEKTEKAVLVPAFSDDEKPESKINLIADVVESENPPEEHQEEIMALPQKEEVEISPEHEGAGRIFLKAVRWDLGIFSEENIKETDWDYYLTYCKGIKIVLEDGKDILIDLPLPLERCIREAADGLINNIKPFIVHKVSDESLFKACMESLPGFCIQNISIVGQNDHILLEFNNIMELNRNFYPKNRFFVENKESVFTERTKAIFFSQNIDSNEVIYSILNLKGFDTLNSDENIVTLLINDTYDNKSVLMEAVEKLNGMYLRDEQNRLVSVKIDLRAL